MTARLNEYSAIVVDEARRRGIDVEVLDAGTGEAVLSHGGRSVHVIQSLSELTSAVAFRRCDDKLLSRRVLADAGCRIPPGRRAESGDGNGAHPTDGAFLDEHAPIVVKPARGEGGAGLTVMVADRDSLEAAVAKARRVCPDVLLEAMVEGDDVRVLVIDAEVVAAAVRRPPAVVGDGETPLGSLVEDLATRRHAETGGVSRLALDDETGAHLDACGWSVDDVPADGEVVAVRGTANVHTGGTIDDVTDELHPGLADVARRAAAAIRAPVVGVDLMVPAVDGDEHVVIEVNEQPGLANHGDRPTAQRYIDLLFPATAR